MATIKINGTNLNINVKGRGKPFILIHSVGGDQTQLENLVERFSPEYRVITFDCRGHGQSDKPINYTMDDHVADVLGIMDHFGIGSTYLNGISMGSYIAQGVAIAAPVRVAKLILTVPKSNGLTSSVKRLMTEHAKELEGLNQHETMLVLLKHMVYNQEVMLKHLDVFESKLAPLQFAAANSAAGGFDFRKQLPSITAKTLVISGRYDGLNPPEEGRLCASLIPNAKFIEMQYSGHAPLFEEPDAYLKTVENFLLES